MRIRSTRKYSAFNPDRKMGPLERAFWRDYESRRDIYLRIFEMIVEVADRGWKRWSINAAFETARYMEAHHQGTRQDIYYLNNNHRRFAARLFKVRYPQYAYMIRSRKAQKEE